MWAKRIGQQSWQFPQGGIDAGESAEQAMYRELHEELGLQPEHVRVMGATQRWLRYRLPAQLVRRRTGRTCIGQKQRWFALELVADESLVRFDAVYHGHFKCNRQKLSEMPVLWAYARDLFQTPGFGDTTDFTQIKQHYYIVHSDINPTGVVPKGPDLANWLTPHGRESLGGRPFGDGTPPGLDRDTPSPRTSRTAAPAVETDLPRAAPVLAGRGL